jgi:SSS family solute:Na+ symporter
MPSPSSKPFAELHDTAAYSFMLGLWPRSALRQLLPGLTSYRNTQRDSNRFQMNFRDAALTGPLSLMVAGVAFAAFGIAALVAAAIMAIAAADLLARKVFREFWQPNCRCQRESRSQMGLPLSVALGRYGYHLGAAA